MRFFWAIVVASLIGAGGPVAAKDLALVVDQQEYRRLPDLGRDTHLTAMLSDLEAAGFEVSVARDATVGELRAAAFSLHTSAQAGADRLVIVLQGHLVNHGGQTWLVGQESATPDRFDIGGKGLALDVFDATLGSVSGRAILAVIEDPKPLRNLADLSAGTAPMDMPQGATLLRGDSHAIRRSLTELLKDGGTTADLMALSGGATVSGFVSSVVAFTQPSASSPAVAHGGEMGEIAYWGAVRDVGTAEALTSYLARYPNGVFAIEARRQLQMRENDRVTRVQAAEQALGLNRDQRRSVQRDLALLGFDPRGVDGVFGPATRRAISAWQLDQRLENHGYLDRDQLALMQEFALRRAAELEEEARRRRQIEETRDRTYWQDTGSRGTEAGYRRYLRAFPDGVFSDLARAELARIEEARRATLNTQERLAWDRAQQENSVESYEAFLKQFPRGQFADVAQARIEELERDAQERDAERQFSAVENAVAGNSAARMLIERQLTNLGLNPGPADGKFTRETRRSLRRFQKARNLDVTGYVNRPTMVHLLLGR